MRDAGELGHHRRPADERVRVRRHHDEVGDSEQQRGTRDRRTVDDHDGRDDAGAVGQRLRGEPPTVQRGESLDDVGAARAHDHDQREALAPRACSEASRSWPTSRTTTRRPGACVDIDPHDLRPSNSRTSDVTAPHDSVAKVDGHHRPRHYLDGATEGEGVGTDVHAGLLRACSAMTSRSTASRTRVGAPGAGRRRCTQPTTRRGARGPACG